MLVRSLFRCEPFYKFQQGHCTILYFTLSELFPILSHFPLPKFVILETLTKLSNRLELANYLLHLDRITLAQAQEY